MRGQKIQKWQYGICIAIMIFFSDKEWSQGPSLGSTQVTTWDGGLDGS
jgi:hypothetical protein